MKKKKREITKVTVEVYEDRREEWNSWFLFMSSSAKLGRSITAYQFKRFLSCFYRERPADWRKKEKRIKELTDETIQHFTQKKYRKYKYDFLVEIEQSFSGHMQDIPPPEERLKDRMLLSKLRRNGITREYSLKLLCEQIYEEILLAKKTSPLKTDDPAVKLRYIYNKVSQYTDKVLPTVERFGPTKKRTVAGVIASKLDLLPKDYRQSTSDLHLYLADRMRTYTKPKKKGTGKSQK